MASGKGHEGIIRAARTPKVTTLQYAKPLPQYISIQTIGNWNI